MSNPKADRSPLRRELETGMSAREILAVIQSFKVQVANDRTDYIKKRIKTNNDKVSDIAKNLYQLSLDRRNENSVGVNGSLIMLAKRQKDAIDKYNAIGTSDGAKGSSSSEEDVDGYTSSPVLLGHGLVVKNAVRPIKLPEVENIPAYTSWIFLDRNQRMAEDQSVVGRRRIYYDQKGGEALIASDSEEEAIEDEDSKKEFRDSEDYVLRMTIKEVGLSDTTLDLLARTLSRKPCEIQERYECLIKNENATCNEVNGNAEVYINPYIDKDLDAALDSFDNLFCRRCLVFDCKLHGCSQDLIFPTEKPSSWASVDVEKDPCGPNCYRLEIAEQKLAPASVAPDTEIQKGECGGPSARLKSKSYQIGSAASSEIKLTDDVNSPTAARKCGGDEDKKKRVSDNHLVAVKKRLKKTDSVSSRSISSDTSHLQSDSNPEDEDNASLHKVKSVMSRKLRQKESQVLESEKSLPAGVASDASNETESDEYLAGTIGTLRKEEFVGESMYKQQQREHECWKPLEKALCEKGFQIFGCNSCLIARNVMNGSKSCSDVFNYMVSSGKQSVDGMYLAESHSNADRDGAAVRSRSRFLHRKGRGRRLKYTWKSAGYTSFRKRSSEMKEEPRQYNPCGCQSGCGKECPCQVNGTCCEKFCGCSKNCKHRFRGCHCAKNACRSRQCPCFAADRECDPDVCRNCWIGCGDDTIVGPSKSSDSKCKNMKLLLRQRQRVMLGRSDVSGWGAFLKNSVVKNDYLGEYTGELISHYEAEKRGKIYDRVNQSFLFNLNNQFVLDAYRKGDKLKFANHSPDPNCYAKVVSVNGDHRVGIFAKQRIDAGAELFYDYQYTPECTPDWAKKPETSGTKKANITHDGRAKKNA